jgi:hypothetical protein
MLGLGFVMLVRILKEGRMCGGTILTKDKQDLMHLGNHLAPECAA